MTDWRGNTYKINTHNHIIFKRTCVEVNELKIINTNTCYEDILAEIALQNKMLKAFFNKGKHNKNRLKN